MKKLLTVFCFMLSLNLFAQEQIINSFDAASADTNYWAFFDNHGGKHFQTNTSATPDSGYLNMTYVSTPAPQEGTAAMRLEYSVQNSESWGGYTKLEHWNPDPNGVYDWSLYTNIAFWYYNEVPQDESGRVHLRLCLHDVSESTDYNIYTTGQTEYYYSFEYILDNEPGWNLFQLPLVNNLSMDGQGFNRTGWNGIVGNNILDLDKIKGFSLEFSINGSGSGDAVKGVLILDKLFLTGIAARPVVMFNGASVPNNVACSAWNGSFEIEAGSGYDGITPAIKWMHGAGQAWTGIMWDFNTPVNLAYHWATDTLKFWMKAPAGTGNLRIQWEDAAATVGKIGKNFDPIADDTWHYYEFALKDMNTQYDGTTTFDPSQVNVFQIMTEGNGSGKTLYLDNVWTGSPYFDVIAPDAPAAVTAFAGELSNNISWIDVPGESNEVYDVYCSFNPITDINASGVENVAYGVEEGLQLATHVLKAPVSNKELTYYYAAVCRDEANNVSEIATASSSITNTAKGVPIIHPAPPASFVADGDLGEWSSLAPFIIKPSDNSGTVVSNTAVDGDADCSAQVWLAVDPEYLYVAFDVTDDIVSSDPSISSYLRDAPDLFIGLYDWRGPTHVSLKRGAEPDYQIRFNKEGAIVGNLGDDVIGVNDDADYEWFEKFGSGYAIEAKFPWTALANAITPADNVFLPAVGMRIRMDFSFNDADATGTREGILTYSSENQDHSYEHVWRWTYTWIGDQMVDVEEEVNGSIPTAFELNQNYPNPFNPTTNIKFSLANDANVSLKVYNVLGQEVASLVNDFMRTGYYEVNFDASNLASGVYVYQLNAGSFISSKKMLLVK